MEENRQNEKLENAFDPAELEVCGFRFLTKSDAEKARVDEGKIEYIQSHVAYTTASSLLAVYEKAIANKIFGTPVGWTFLQDLRKQLRDMGVGDQDLSPIPMTSSFTRPLAQTTDTQSVALAVSNRKIEKEKKPPALILSVAMNIILAILVVAMFVILFFGETDNMINYKRNINNRYSSWEEELKLREQQIKDKEKELGIQFDR